MSEPVLRSAVPVLTYHSIDGSASPVSTSAEEFRRQMEALASAGWRTLGLDAFMQGYRGGGWPPRTFALTFDDGYRNLLDDALPIASRCGFTATVFVATDRVGGSMRGPGEAPWTPDAPLLDWGGLRAVASAGWTIASHACSHRALTSLSPEDAASELATAKATVEEEIGERVTAFAYPYGATSNAVEQLAGWHYEACFGTTLAHVTTASRPVNFERIDVYYLRGVPAGALDGPIVRAYLAVRRAGRAMRQATARR